MRLFVIGVLACIGLMHAAATGAAPVDVGKRLIFDMPQHEMIQKYGKLAGQDLLAEELVEMAGSPFRGDTLRLLVVLVEWTDRPGTYSRETFESFFFSRDEYPGGSVADYFDEVSYGQIAVTGDVIDWFNAGLYSNIFDFSALLEPLDPIVDYSVYDGDHNNHVDAICFVRSGNGEEDSGDPNDIWSYASVSPFGNVGFGPYDGVRINRYNTCPETRPLRDPLNPTQFSGVDEMNRIRVFCHELAHNAGLPDLYDYDDKLVTSTYRTPNDENDHPLVDWCLMGYYGYGLFSIGSDVPSHICGWSRMQMGWLEPVVVPEDYEGPITINNIETAAEAALFKLPVDPAAGEYFLLEYRNRQSGAVFDKLDSDFSCYFWPNLTYGCDPIDRGLLITHIDDSLVPEESWYYMNNGFPRYAHYSVVVEDAGYNPSRPAGSNPEGHVTDSAQWWYPYETRKGALFSDDVNGQNEFGPQTVPSSDGYGGYSGVYVRVDSIVGDQLFAYVSSNYPIIHCCATMGDIDRNGLVDLFDVLFLVDYFYKGGAPPECDEEADADSSGQVDPMDMVYLMEYFFDGGPAPPPCPE